MGIYQLRTLPCYSVSRGLAWWNFVNERSMWAWLMVLYLNGMAHSPAGVCLWQVCFTEGPRGQGGSAYLHPRMVIQPIASLERNIKGWHNPECT